VSIRPSAQEAAPFWFQYLALPLDSFSIGRHFHCCIVDDVTIPNMAYTEYSFIILNHFVLAKFNILIAIDIPCKLVVLNRVT
jgi:hypothetical protein